MIISISLLAPSPRITKERAEAWEARESRDCTCVKATACLRSRRRRLLTLTSLVLEWRGWDPTPPSSGNVNSDFVLALFFFLHYFSNGENEGEENIVHMSLSYPMRHFTHRPTLRLSLNPHYRCGYYGARAGTRPFFVIVSSESPPSVRHPRPVYVPAAHPPQAPFFSRPSLPFFSSSSLLSHALSLCLSTTADFLFPSPSGSAPPRRVRVTQTVYISLINLPFSSSHLSVFLSATNRPHKQKQPMIHVFLFAIHRNDLACST